ncbi:MAG: aryl-sulfate sulfotransferase [Planctomycetes bacterium]|nr:aryl-sulfate sulfotransferase [Planctomycetota bacterium]MCB9901871.1 aryl-sulfate sulfotransferase [Planctomycetota bacterium]
MSTRNGSLTQRRHVAERLPRLVVFLSFLLLATACGGGSAATVLESPTVVPGPMPHAVEVEVPLSNPDAVERITYRIRSMPGARAQDVVVRFERTWLDRNEALTRMPGFAVIPVFGLYAAYVNDVEIDVQLQGGKVASSTIAIETPPESLGAPGWNVDQAEPGLAMDFFTVQSQGPPVVVDVDGKVRWCAPDLGEPVFPFVITPDGMIVGSLFSNAWHGLDWLGNKTPRQMQDPRCGLSHHNLTLGKVGILNTVTWLGDDYMRQESVLAELTNDGALIRAWDFDQIVADAIVAGGEDPASFVQGPADWFHMNAGIYDPTDDSVVVSSRENFVMKVDYATGAIRWILGNPGKAWFADFPNSLATFALTVNGLPPIGQHAISMSADGQRLLCFDNGKGNIILPNVGDDRITSRVVEYVIDPVARTATESWVFELDPADRSDYCSSAYRTRAGDVILVSSGPADAGSARLFVVRDDGTVMFRASPVEGRCNAAYRCQEAPWNDLTLE